MNTALIAGYPKSGNTLIGATCNIAGGVSSDFDIYGLRANHKSPQKNGLFASDICTIKSHDCRRRLPDFRHAYFGRVINVVTVVRNPFETLLSVLNYFRVLYSSKGFLSALQRDSLNDLLPGYEVKASFCEDFELDKLREEGLIALALKNFALNGTVVRMFYQSSGPWSEFVLGYQESSIPVLNLRFEELALESLGNDETHSKCSTLLSNFWDCEYARLKQAFMHQGSASRKQKESGNPFYAKAESGYWRTYFDIKDCKNFANYYYRSMVANGYEDLLDELFSQVAS
jgi:hypothetical protein